MVCIPCKKQAHHACPEVERQLAYGAERAIELLGGQKCDCQHDDTPGMVRKVA